MGPASTCVNEFAIWVISELPKKIDTAKSAPPYGKPHYKVCALRVQRRERVLSSSNPYKLGSSTPSDQLQAPTKKVKRRSSYAVA
jgi:hypothetical protein